MSGACSIPEGRVGVLIQCTGARIRRIELPPFAMHAGESVCIQWPLPAGTPEQEALLDASTRGQKKQGSGPPSVRQQPLYFLPVQQ